MKTTTATHLLDINVDEELQEVFKLLTTTDSSSSPSPSSSSCGIVGVVGDVEVDVDDIRCWCEQLVAKSEQLKKEEVRLCQARTLFREKVRAISRIQSDSVCIFGIQLSKLSC